MLRQVTLEDIEPISLGAGILGTGGGGNPYLGALHLSDVMRKSGPAEIVDPFELDDDALVPMIGFIGAPTASIEKIHEGTELLAAVRLLEAHVGRKVDALGIAEIGGANSMGPLVTSLQAGIPVVDCDSMGRAFPELQMSVFLFQANASVTPLAMVDAGGNCAVIAQTVSAVWAERLARNLATSMGATAGLAYCLVTGRQIKAYGIHYTLSLAHRVGQHILRAQEAGDDVPEAITDILSGRIFMRGKIVDVNRRTTRGFARGTLTIESFGATTESLYIEFQNEFLIAYLNHDIIATVPDLICIVAEETGEPVSTEVLRYGMRVAVLGVPAARQLKTPSALQIVGPHAFGYDGDFLPLPGNTIGVDFRIAQT